MAKYKINENTDKLMAKRLLEERIKLEKNRKEFVKNNEISYSNLDNWESGRRDFPVHLLKKMDELGADIYYVVTGKHLTAQQSSNTSSALNEKLLEHLEGRVSSLERENELLREKVAILEGAGASSTVYEQSSKRDESAG